jgi:dienelactone hydrolase
MELIGDPIISHGVVERRFDVHGGVDVVPGLLWTPEGATGPRPLVLIGHGGGSDKRTPYVVSMARRLVRHAGYAAAAIDAPGHGERSGAATRAAGTAGTAESAEEGIPGDFMAAVAAAADLMTADWTRTLEELRALDDVGRGPLGYWGLSMGTMFGSPFVAATPDVQCAVLGLMGTFDDANPWTVAAAQVTCPVLFLVQTDDELVPAKRALALFQSLGSKDKRLHAHPGAHSAVPLEEIDASEAFFAHHLV